MSNFIELNLWVGSMKKLSININHIVWFEDGLVKLTDAPPIKVVESYNEIKELVNKYI